MSEYTEAHKTFDGVRYVTVKLANKMLSEENEVIEKLQAENEALKAKLIEDEWISVEDRLPPERKYVLIYVNKDNWISHSDPKGIYYCTATLCKGISIEEREAMKRGDLPDKKYRGETLRSAVFTEGDEYGNNTVPYCWVDTGSGNLFGQEVDYWMPLPEPPKEISND